MIGTVGFWITSALNYHYCEAGRWGGHVFLQSAFEFFETDDVGGLVAGNDDFRPVFDYWKALKGGATMPPAADIDLHHPALKPDNLMLLKVIDGGQDFLYLHHGAVITKLHGADMTGKMLSDVSAIPTVRLIRHYRDVVARQRPSYTLHRTLATLASGYRDPAWERLILPCADAAGARVETILVGRFLRPWNYAQHLYNDT